MSIRSTLILLLVLICALSVCTESSFAHGVFIGRSAAGQLRAVNEAPMPVELPPSIFPGINGWAAPEPGIASLKIEEPAEDLFFLDPACDIHFIFVGADPGLQIVTDHVWVPGENVDFGPPFFDEHLVFNIPNAVFGQEYALQFRLHDANGIHSDSEIHTLTFTPVAQACECRGDTNADSARDGADVQQFLTCVFETPKGEPPDSDCRCADIDGDGALDELDLAEFVEHLLTENDCH